MLERLNGQEKLEAQRAEEAGVQSSGSGTPLTTDDSSLQVLIVGAGN